MLQAMLELTFPSNRFEVINVAMTAINSHAIREIAKDCAPLEGDVWIVYMGNNEVVGPFGGGTVFGRQAPSRAFIRTVLWLKQFRLVQWLGSLRSGGPAQWEGMEMFLKQQVPRNDPRLTKVYLHFRENLRDIVRIGSGAGAKVLVGTVAVNLKDCPPFASQHSVSLNDTQRAEFTRLMREGSDLANRSEFASAQAAFSNAQFLVNTAGGDHFAEIYFHLARCELALGKQDEARHHFNAAREYDTLRFRADDQIELAIRETVASPAKSMSHFVDVANPMRMASSNFICGADLFYEHVHPTFEGNYQLARTFFDDVVRALPPSVAPNGVPQVPTSQQCARRLAWTDWDRLQVYEEVRKRLQQPPFTAQFGHEQRDREWRERIDDLAASLTPARFQEITALYQETLRAAPRDWVLRENFARLLEGTGDVASAIEQWREVARLLPHDVQAQYHLGNLLDTMGRSDAALVYLHAALRRNPSSAEARNALALALGNLGRTAEAEREFETLLRLKPKFTEARVNLGQLFAKQGKVDAAIAQYQLALRHDTNSAAAHVNLGRLLSQRGDKAGALTQYQSALRINPRHAIAHFNLGNALSATNAAEAARHYTEAVRINPGFAEAHLALALQLAKAGQPAEAEKHFAETIRLQPQSADAHFNYGAMLANQKRFPEAAREFTKTLELQPDHPMARQFLSRVQGR
jgi:tetratricopeptide (TPR) repeat protein